MKLDRYDRAIVRALQLDGSVTNSQLADGVSLHRGIHRADQSAKGGVPGQRIRQYHLGATGTGTSACLRRSRT
jgi:hypothetical protein